MAKFMVLHTHQRPADEFAAAFTPEALQQMAPQVRGKPGGPNCLLTWNPLPYGRGEYMYCLWEAPSIEAVKAALTEDGMDYWFTHDIMQVDEINWAELAQMAGAA